MALLDLVVNEATNAVVHDGVALKDFVSGATPTNTGVNIDPIVSGTDYSVYLSGATLTLASIPIDRAEAVSLEFYFHVGTTAGTIIRAGSTPFDLVDYNADGSLTITLPYVSRPVVKIDFRPKQSNQLILDISRTGYAVILNGYSVASGSGEYEIDSVAQFDFGSDVPVSFGGMFVYEFEQGEAAAKDHYLEAFSVNSTALPAFASDIYEATEENQRHAVRFDVPLRTSWEDLESENVTSYSGLLGLKLRRLHSIDSTGRFYTSSKLSELLTSASGEISVYDATYTTGTGNRGCIYLSRKVEGAVDEHVLRFENAALVYIYRQWGLDGSNNLQWTETPTTIATTTNGARTFGFSWSATTLNVIYNGVETAVQTDYGLPIALLDARYGVDHEGNLFFNSVDLYDWELRTNRVPETSPSGTTYGDNSFITSSSERLPVMSEGYVAFEVPLVGEDDALTIRRPYYEIEGTPNGTVTETYTAVQV